MPGAPTDRRVAPDGGAEAHVHVVGAGGTIANHSGAYDSPDGFLPVADVVERVPGLSDVARVTTTDVFGYVSEAMTGAVWFDLHDEIMGRASGSDPPDGFVVTHGSNSAEETAYLLTLALETDRPVVVTAAQRGLSARGTDALKNLYDAVRVAATPAARGRGALLVANDEVHHARDVTKLASARPDAWASPNAGPVGRATPDQPVRFTQSVERSAGPETPFDLADVAPEAFPLSDVRVVYATVAASGAQVDAALADDPAGLVVAGFPTGHAARPDGTDSQAAALRRAADRGVPVVMTSRGTQGRIDPGVLDHVSSDQFVAGDTLTPQKARVLLALALLETTDPATIEEYFRTY
jgi:L-asparaginase